MHTYTYICVAGAVPRVNDSFSGVPKQNMGSPLTVSAGGGHVAIIDIEKRLFTWSQTNSSGTHALAYIALEIPLAHILVQHSVLN